MNMLTQLWLTQLWHGFQVRPEKLGEVLATQPSLLLASVESLEDALVLIYTFLEYTFTWIT